jgi:outer membrane protein
VRLFAAALVLGLAGVASAQTAPTKVGIINIQQAILGTRDGQKAMKDLEAKAAPKKAELEKRQQEIRGLEEKLNRASNVGGEEEKQRLARDIDQKKKAFSRDVDDAQLELDQENSKAVNAIGAKMMAVLDKYAKDNGYAVILDVSGQNQQNSAGLNVIFAANGTDVTPEIISLYDKNAGTGPTSAAPAPGAAPAAPAAAKPATPAPAAARPATTPPVKK